jgi:parvulin-like peptidyl-prolyl isomerase
MLWTVLIAGCSGSPGGPANLGRINAADDDPPPVLQSNDILEREQRADKAQVKHILISWRDLADAFDGRQDERAQNRSRGDAEKLVKELYNRAVAGEPFEALMAEYSEDQGSASTGISYEVFPGSSHVFEFRRMGIRLEVGEVGKVLSQFGWHVMKRVE